ncbi:unnamed protein product [Arabis nemorensis]|uniref:Uncharacterized protein n=1 Tax=Arabis nemorensis TaxID=586526 RepID=A0A565BP98_9BRAS|nr:unnamed protein product [Arabis nemorensis]
MPSSIVDLRRRDEGWIFEQTSTSESQANEEEEGRTVRNSSLWHGTRGTQSSTEPWKLAVVPEPLLRRHKASLAVCDCEMTSHLTVRALSFSSGGNPRVDRSEAHDFWVKQVSSMAKPPPPSEPPDPPDPPCRWLHLLLLRWRDPIPAKIPTRPRLRIPYRDSSSGARPWLSSDPLLSSPLSLHPHRYRASIIVHGSNSHFVDDEILWYRSAASTSRSHLPTVSPSALTGISPESERHQIGLELGLDSTAHHLICRIPQHLHPNPTCWSPPISFGGRRNYNRRQGLTAKIRGQQRHFR